MFLIYINDLVKFLAQYNVRFKLFADDVKLYVKVVSYVNIAELYMALSALAQWADEWQLSVPVNKIIWCALRFKLTMFRFLWSLLTVI